MFKHYAVVFFRHFWKNKISLILSFIGLTLAFSFTYVVGITAKDTLNSDRWLTTSDRLYRVIQAETKGGWQSTTAGPVAPIIRQNLDEVETVVRLIHVPIKGAAGVDKTQFGFDGTFVDGDFASAFPLPVVTGDLARTLEKPRGLVLSRSEAERLFGSDDPIGATVPVDIYGTIYDYEVGAVIDHLPEVSHMSFNMIMPFILDDVKGSRVEREATGFGATGAILTYLLLKNDVDQGLFEKNFWSRIKFLFAGEYAEGREYLKLENVTGLQFWSLPRQSLMVGPVDPKAVMGVSITAILVLIAAISNHMNLNIAIVLRRGREVAVRRILGASRIHVAVQFFIEMLILTMLAAWLALDIAPFIADYVSGYVGQNLTIDGQTRWLEITVLMLTGVLSAFLVALYPIFWIARTHARSMLGMSQAAVTGGGSKMRVILIGLQVALGMGLLFSTLTIEKQVSHLVSVDKGFDFENKLHIEKANGEVWVQNRETFINEVMKLEGIEAYSSTSTIPFVSENSRYGFRHPVTKDIVVYEGITIDPEFFANYAIKPLSGRNLNYDYAGDLLAVRSDQVINKGDESQVLTQNIVISEAVAKAHGFTSNDAAIGQVFRRGHNDVATTDYEQVIVGVIPDLNFKAGKQLSLPTFYFVDDRDYWYLTFDVSAKQFDMLVPQIKAVWQRIFPDDVFNYSLAQDNLTEAYWEENQMLKLFVFAGVLSLLITITGIYSLAQFLIRQRTREVAMRKVLGARTRDILELIIKEFSKPVIAGLLVGIPAAVYFLEDWLSLYQVRLDFGAAEAIGFAFCGFIFCLAVVFSEAIRAIRIRPAKVLYHE